MTDTYDDIINLPHPTSAKHPRMSMHARAAQFAPFAAINGHKQAIDNSSKEVQAMFDNDENKEEDYDYC